MDDNLKRNAAAALSQILDVRKDEVFLVITDAATREVGEAFYEAAGDLEARATLYLLPAEQRPLTSIPEDLMALIPDCDLAVTCFTGRPEETPFRIALIKALTMVVRRLGHAPGITVDMLASGPMSVDYTRLGIQANDLIARFDGATTARITAPGGTDLSLDISDRPFETDAVIADGHWGNLPAGEIWCAPVEEAADGFIVCDGSIGDLGPVPAPLTIHVVDGRVQSIECEDEAFLRRVDEALCVDENARVIGELGIGLNPGARLTGNLLEDEKAGRTAHVAFGNNEDMGGGRNRSKTHRDFLFRDPTIEVRFADGRTETLLKDGELTGLAPRASASPGWRHVLVAVDFSEASDEALKVGDMLARASGAKLSVCHVVLRTTPMSPLFPHDASVPAPDQDRRREEDAVARIDALVASITGRAAEDYDAVVLAGNPAEAVVGLARERGVDLIVVASAGETGLQRMLLGSVAEAIARTAECHVLLAR